MQSLLIICKKKIKQDTILTKINLQLFERFEKDLRSCLLYGVNALTPWLQLKDCKKIMVWVRSHVVLLWLGVKKPFIHELRGKPPTASTAVWLACQFLCQPPQHDDMTLERSPIYKKIFAELSPRTEMA